MSSRAPATVASAVGGRGSIVIRPANADDRPALDRLQALAERRLPDVPLIVAEVDGDLLAAAPTTGGAVVSDPFRVTLDAAELLRLLSSQLRSSV